jgi:hypothetical protein
MPLQQLITLASLGICRIGAMYYICEALEANPDWALRNPVIQKCLDALEVTTDVRATLKEHLPDAEWEEAADLILTQAPHHCLYNPATKYWSVGSAQDASGRFAEAIVYRKDEEECNVLIADLLIIDPEGVTKGLYSINPAASSGNSKGTAS